MSEQQPEVTTGPVIPTKVCPNCGVQSQTTADKCPSCGKPYSQKKKGGCLKWGAISLLALVVLIAACSALVSGSSDDDNSGGGGDTDAAETEASSNKADDDNEPHVGPKGTVVVDTLTWQVLGARKAEELGSEFSSESADGVYVVAQLRVHNGKDESVTISSDIATLEVNGKEYKYDSDGTTALTLGGGGEETFFLKDLGPDVRTTGYVVFDVPPAALRQKPEICFHELGFGSTKGCIRLPPV